MKSDNTKKIIDIKYIKYRLLSTVLTGLRLSVSREMSLFLSPGCCCAGRSSVTDFIKKSTTQLMESYGQLCSWCPVEDNLLIRNQFSFTQNYHQYPSIIITILKKLTSYHPGIPWTMEPVLSTVLHFLIHVLVLY